MSLTLAELFTSPDHYLHSFADGAAVFVPMDRDAYRRSVFLDDRIEPARAGSMRVPLGMLAGQAPAPQPTGWIFHVAHCGSTLLANALDALGPSLVLREPFALRQLALEPELNHAALAIELAMLGKAYDPATPTLVKANVPVNFILDSLAELEPRAPAIMLYLGLEDYLCAILRSANHRKWLRGISAQPALPIGAPAGADDAVLAAALWRAQGERFAVALQAMPNARSLDAELFYADPGPVIAAAARLLGIATTLEAIRRLVEGSVFQTYSKVPGVAFSNADRIGRRVAARTELSEEIAMAHRWLNDTGEPAEALQARLKGHELS